MIEFSLEGSPHVTLNNLLKLTGLCHSGGFAKALIHEGLVQVDGEVEYRKTNKIVAGQTVTFENQTIKVISGDE